MESHVLGRSLAANEHFIILHLHSHIITSRQDETTGLAVHSLRSQCGCNQKNFSILQCLCNSLIELHNLYLNKCVLIWHNTFSLSPIMISAHLAIFGRVNGCSLSILDIPSFFQQRELPPNEGIIVRIDFSCNKGSAVIHMHSELLDVFPSLWREKLYPMLRIHKIRDLLLGDSRLFQDLVLIFGFSAGDCFWELGRVAVGVELEPKFLSGG